MGSKKFLAIVCSLFTAFILPVILVNTYTNSYGYYGDRQLVEAPIFNAHISKYYYLKN